MCIALTLIKRDAILFIQRRVNEIKSYAEIDFRYVATHDNPGDIAIKRNGTKELQNAIYGGMNQTG